MATETPFTPDHSDRVTVLQLNHDSSKLLTGSIDHRIAIYDIDASTGQRKQLDVFTAHDAEIRDAKWFHPSTGTNFVTIGNDLQMRIWTQELSQAPMSGRRFRKIGFIKSEQLVPFVSLNVKTIGMTTYITVIDRQGLLSLYEPSNPDSYKEWTLIDQFYVCTPIPSRSDHTSFRVQFDPNPFPLPYLTSLSDDREQLSIAVAAMNHIKLYRTTSDPDAISTHLATLPADSPANSSSNNIGRSASHRLFLFQVLSLPAPALQPPTSAGSLLRDIAYSANNIRGTDVLAVASINGIVAIYEISLQSKRPSTFTTTPTTAHHPPSNVSIKSAYTRQTHHSNLTSALNPTSSTSASHSHNPSSTSTAGAATATATSSVSGPATSSNNNTAQQNSSSSPSRSSHPFPYTHQSTPIGVLENAHVDAWSVQWDPCGQILLSTGSDGTVKLWRRVAGVNNAGSTTTSAGTTGVGMGQFELIAEQGEEDESDSDLGEDGRMEDGG